MLNLKKLLPEALAQYYRYLAMLLTVTACSLLGWISEVYNLAEANVVMIFLAGVALVAALFGRGPAVAAALLSVVIFDFFFVAPRLSFVVSDVQYFITLSVMLGIGFLISALTSRLRSQLAASEVRERRGTQLYEFTRQLSELSGTDRLLRTAARTIEEIFDCEAVVFLRQPDHSLTLEVGQEFGIAKLPANSAAAEWVGEHSEIAGANTPNIPEASALFVPMIGSERTVGVLGVTARAAQKFAAGDERNLLMICASLIALSIERDQSVEQTHRAQIEVQQARSLIESEQMRNSMLSAVSHDLRTPLATIAVTASSLLADTNGNSACKHELLQTIVDESHRLGRQVENLLGHARLTSGAIALNREWEALDELVEAALARIHPQVSAHTIVVNIGSEIPPLWVAGDLIEHVFVNLLDNATHYTAQGSKIEISAALREDVVEIAFCDNGPGLPEGSELKVFDKFFRGTTLIADGHRGIGLGLAICKAIVQAHGGQMTAANCPTGGAQFVIALPCTRQEPQDSLDKSVTSSTE